MQQSTDTILANKYKQYNKLRVALLNPTATPDIKKRSSPKRRKLSQPQHPAIIDPYDSPRSVHRTPSLQRTCIGPTPQKDGRVLGLFDLLSPESKDGNTPSKKKSFGTARINTLFTPPKPVATGSSEVNGETPVDGKPSEPLRSGSNHGPYLTPLTRQSVDHRTPGTKSGVSKLRFDVTPAFLRRDSQGARNVTTTRRRGDTGEIEELSWSPVAVRKRPRPIGRSLSALVSGLRALEDEKLDEEMELMRELEQEDSVERKTQPSKFRDPNVAVEDSQTADMPLGPDGAGSSEDDSRGSPIEGKGKDGKPLKVWKKKGQKRSTRKSNMKPATGKWKPEPQWKAPTDAKNVDEVALIPETQFSGYAAACEATASMDEGDGLEYPPDGDDRADGHETGENRIPLKSLKDKENANCNIGQGAFKEAPKKKKINPLAHANFRALKIKNKQSKAKGGGRYGRKRR